MGLIGLGNMGTAVAERLLEAEFPLVVYNRTPSKTELLAARGATVAGSPGDLAREADVVLTSLSDDDALEAVAGDVLAGSRPGTVLVDLSTVSAAASARIAAVAEAAVVGAADPITGQGIVAFVTVKGSEAADAASGERLVAELRDHVADQIGKIARPRQILLTPDLPKTRSGKIMRRLLRDVAEHRELGDVTTLADPSVVQMIDEKMASASAFGDED